MTVPPSEHEQQHQRWELLRRLDRLTNVPMTLLAFVWLALLIVDLTPFWQTVSNLIWGLSILDFLLALLVAPDRSRYLQANLLTAFSLLLPALRILRIFRAFRALRLLRATRSINLLRLLTSLNRGLKAVGGAVRHRGLGYVVLLTVILTLGGAAGMLAFERSETPGRPGLNTYPEALWWTAMLMTSLGSDYWPVSLEGRLLTFLLALYALAVFGYITAAIASLFIDQDRKQAPADEKEVVSL
ncbi:hypothetical protein GCM10008955_37870 [Deinococcus malanensis]|uniref:Ion transport domain-containing protein n=1 Tax=Deinococcus malanensis TaxID=1706855 RepID=A0ABQ2F245_9DEIO|nr:ion transporter [Deinococcus malanensis]GGK40489.1 hypothetical protein GCM10008955_37870 [Deinococcus malanensis]